MIDKLVKRQNDNHSPGPVTWEIPSSYQGAELINTILCTFSRGNQRIGVGVPIPNSGSLTSVPELSVWKAFYHVKSRSSTGILDLHLSRSTTKPTIWLVRQAKTQISLGIRPVIRVFAVRMKKPWVLGIFKNAQRRLIRLGGCPCWFESSLCTQVMLLVLSCGG